MSHDLPPSNSNADDDSAPTETNSDVEPADETPETRAHRIWQAALRGIESEWAPSAIRDKLGAAIVAKAFQDPKRGLHITFRRRPGEKRTPRQPWYKYSQNDDKAPDETP